MRVFFFYPEMSVGGAQYLFARMAAFLSTHDHEVFVIDYEDSFAHSALRGSDVKFIRFLPGNKLHIDEGDSVLIISLSYLRLIKQHLILGRGCRLLLWDLHPYNLIEYFSFSGFYKMMRGEVAQKRTSLFEPGLKRKLQRLVEMGVKKGGLFFMAQKNYHLNYQILGCDVVPQFLPLPIEMPATFPRERERRRSCRTPVQIAWLSRLAPEKIRALFRLIDDVEKSKRNASLPDINLHIIGDGESRSLVLDKCKKIEYSYTGKLMGDNLTRYILDQIDVGFGMGTSALEFAARGIPTVLTSSGLPQDDINSHTPYRWLHESKGFNVTAEEAEMDCDLVNLQSVIQAVVEHSKCKALGSRTFRYAQKNHDSSIVGKLLIQSLQKCRLTYGDIVDLGFYEATNSEMLLMQGKSIWKKAVTLIRA